MPEPWRPWRQAMAEALYGEQGFYRRPGAPASGFRTSAHTGELWAAAWLELAQRTCRAMGHPAGFTVVDIGAGGGELLGGLAAKAPADWRLVGVDVAGRPAGLSARVEWVDRPPRSVIGLMLAVERLDVVPVDVVEATDDGVRLVEVTPSGTERLGSAAMARDVEWLDAWWPLAEVGDRAEVGWPRDDAWSAAVSELQRGVAVAVDYAAVPARDVAGTITGYRAGRQVVPVPDGSCDITAHVLMEACARAANADDTQLLTQREALRALGIDATRPSYDEDPVAYLSALSAAGEAAELLQPDGLGGHMWLFQTVGVRIEELGIPAAASGQVPDSGA